MDDKQKRFIFNIGIRLAIGVALCLVVFLFLNIKFFWDNSVYYVLPQKTEHKPFNIPDETKENPKEYPPNTLAIPKFGIEAPIIYAKEENEQSFQSALQKGVGHYPGTAEPGMPGNVFIFGHSSDLPWAKGEYKTIFALLTKMNRGDIIILSDKEGNSFAYHVIDARSVSKNDTSILSQGDKKRSLLTLQTSYPLGTALRRWIVRAEILQ
jgi:sortase A